MMGHVKGTIAYDDTQSSTSGEHQDLVLKAAGFQAVLGIRSSFPESPFV